MLLCVKPLSQQSCPAAQFVGFSLAAHGNGDWRCQQHLGESWLHLVQLHTSFTCVAYAGVSAKWDAKIADFGLHATVDAAERDAAVQQL